MIGCLKEISICPPSSQITLGDHLSVSHVVPVRLSIGVSIVLAVPNSVLDVSLCPIDLLLSIILKGGMATSFNLSISRLLATLFHLVTMGNLAHTATSPQEKLFSVLWTLMVSHIISSKSASVGMPSPSIFSSWTCNSFLPPQTGLRLSSPSLCWIAFTLNP